jgi:methionyl-tRNA formyltransferase
MRLVIFGDGRWAANSLVVLAREYDIAAVVIRSTPSNATLEVAARDLGIPVLQPQRINDPEFVAAVAAMNTDLGISISCNQILRRPVLDSTRLGFINFHAGALPYYRGRNVINWAIINGETEVGLTAHYVDEGIDTGDILLQQKLPIAWTDSYGDVLDRIVKAFPDFVLDAVHGVDSGRLTRKPQDHSAATYFSGRADGDEWLDWSDTSANLYNKIRAISKPGPGARTLLGDRVIVAWKAIYDPSWPRYIATPGQIVGRNNDGVVVKTGDSTLVLIDVQYETEGPEPPSLPIGTRLGVNLMDVVRSLQSRVRELEDKLRSGERTHGASSSR